MGQENGLKQFAVGRVVSAIRLRTSVPPEAGRAEAGSLKIAFILTTIRGQRPQLQARRH